MRLPRTICHFAELLMAVKILCPLEKLLKVVRIYVYVEEDIFLSNLWLYLPSFFHIHTQIYRLP